MSIKLIIRSILLVFALTHVPHVLCMLGTIRTHDQRHALDLFDTVKQDTVKQFNDEYTPTKRKKAQELLKNLESHNAPEINKLIETSEPIRREEQAYFIVDLVGESAQAQIAFKNMPSERAIQKAKIALKLREKTKRRLPKSDAFLLTRRQHKLCNHILDNAQQNGDKKYLLMDATTYNNILELPPHIKKAVGKNIIGVVEKTREEKLANIGICTLGGALSGAAAGYTISGLAKDSDFLKQSVKNAYPVILSATTETLLQEAVTFNHHKVTELLENPNPIKHEHIIDEKVLGAFKESTKINDLNVACKKAAKTAAQETYNTIAPDVLLFDHENGKKGALIGAIAGGTTGFAYGLYQATRPTKQFEISKMKSYKNQ